MEEFINDQAVELDKMEAAMKLTVANKELCEKELHVCIAMCCTHTYAYLPYLLLLL